VVVFATPPFWFATARTRGRESDVVDIDTIMP
jgi:hypothetical protein